MPFDATNFEPPRPPPVKPGRGETALIVAVAVAALVLMALPVPFSALADIAHYLAGRR